MRNINLKECFQRVKSFFSPEPPKLAPIPVETGKIFQNLMSVKHNPENFSLRIEFGGHHSDADLQQAKNVLAQLIGNDNVTAANENNWDIHEGPYAFVSTALLLPEEEVCDALNKINKTFSSLKTGSVGLAAKPLEPD